MLGVDGVFVAPLPVFGTETGGAGNVGFVTGFGDFEAEFDKVGAVEDFSAVDKVAAGEAGEVRAFLNEVGAAGEVGNEQEVGAFGGGLGEVLDGGFCGLDPSIFFMVEIGDEYMSFYCALASFEMGVK